MHCRKTWKEKLENGREPVVVHLAKPFGGVPAGAALLVATPKLVKEYIESIPPGQTATVEGMRRDLARTWNADATCPASTGIFVRIVAEAALEDLAAGTPVSGITPFWRLVDEKSAVAGKLPCPRSFLREMRARERSPERRTHRSATAQHLNVR